MFGQLLLGVTATVIVAGVGHAAEIKLEGKNADGVSVVSVRGDFIERDIERFADVTKDLDDVIISFSSDGGNLSTGIEIGTRIRLRGYRTVVADQEECYSACALAWLGGTTRYVGRGAQIGFHAAYLEKDGRFQETGVGNAVVGGYAANLGLRTTAIIFLTSAPPEGFNHLTADLAQRVGIPAEFTATEQFVSTENPKLRALLERANSGDTGSRTDLGTMYYNGQGVQQDYAEAVRWYRMAAWQGCVTAQYNLGIMYANGQGVRQNYAEAFRWYEKAADQGFAEAQNKLGFMYHLGQGVRQEHAEAFRWYREAADQGHVEAQRVVRDWQPR